MLVALKELNQNPLGASGNPVLLQSVVSSPVLKVERVQSVWLSKSRSHMPGATVCELRGEKSGGCFLGPCLANRPRCLISVAAVLR